LTNIYAERQVNKHVAKLYTGGPCTCGDSLKQPRQWQIDMRLG